MKASSKFDIFPVSSNQDILITYPCPTCGEYYKLGYFYVQAEYDENEAWSEEYDELVMYVFGPETVTCIECGHSNLKNPLFFLTREEAVAYLQDVDAEDLCEISEFIAEVFFEDAQAYIESLKTVTHH